MKRISSNGLVKKTDQNYKDTSTGTKFSFKGSRRRGSGCMSVDVINGRVRLGKTVYDELGRPESADVRLGEGYVAFAPITEFTEFTCQFGKGGVIYSPEFAHKIAELAGINADEVTGSVSVGTYQMQETDDPNIHEAYIFF